jgi:hypothetical protein
MGVNAGRDQAEVDEDYRQVPPLLHLAAPYRHARLSAVKVAADPNNSARFKRRCHGRGAKRGDYAAAAVLHEAGLIDLEALPRSHGVDQSGINGERLLKDPHRETVSISATRAQMRLYQTVPASISAKADV